METWIHWHGEDASIADVYSDNEGWVSTVTLRTLSKVDRNVLALWAPEGPERTDVDWRATGVYTISHGEIVPWDYPGDATPLYGTRHADLWNLVNKCEEWDSESEDVD